MPAIKKKKIYCESHKLFISGREDGDQANFYLKTMVGCVVRHHAFICHSIASNVQHEPTRHTLDAFPEQYMETAHNRIEGV